MRTREDRNIFNLYLDNALQGIGSAGAAVYLSVYLVRVGARPFEVALLTSLPALTMVLASAPAAAYVERQRDLIRTVLRVRFAYYLGPLAVALLMLSPPARQPLVVVVTWTLFSTVLSAFQPAWMAAIAYIVPRGRMLAVTGGRWAVNGAVTAVAVAGFGLLLDRLPFPFNYQAVFLIGFVATLLGMYFYRRIRIPERVSPVPEGKRAAARLRAMGQALIGHKVFLSFLLAAFVYQLATWLPEGLYPVFWVRDLGASNSWIGVRTMTVNVTLTLGYFAWGRITSRLGRGRVLVLCTAATGLYPLLTALAPTAFYLVPIAALRGVFFAGIEVVLFEALLAKSPDEHRPAFVAASTALDNIARLVAPLLGAGLAGLWGIRAALIVGCGVYLMAAVLFKTLNVGEIHEQGPVCAAE